MNFIQRLFSRADETDLTEEQVCSHHRHRRHRRHRRRPTPRHRPLHRPTTRLSHPTPPLGTPPHPTPPRSRSRSRSQIEELLYSTKFTKREIINYRRKFLKYASTSEPDGGVMTLDEFFDINSMRWARGFAHDTGVAAAALTRSRSHDAADSQRTTPTTATLRLPPTLTPPRTLTRTRTRARTRTRTRTHTTIGRTGSTR